MANTWTLDIGLFKDKNITNDLDLIEYRFYIRDVDMSHKVYQDIVWKSVWSCAHEMFEWMRIHFSSM